MDNIFLIDDHIDSCDHFIKALEPKYKIETMEILDLSKIPLDRSVYLVDIHLSQVKGDRVIKYLRDNGAENAVFILITADEETESVMNFYSVYVDDLISKNTNTFEISKRIEVSLDKKKTSKTNLSFKGLELDSLNCTLKHKNEFIDITFIEYKIILAILKNIPLKSDLTKDNLISIIWPGMAVGNKTINSHFGNLNRKLNPFNLRLLINRKSDVSIEENI
jgi:DNA-binding response OmpR family regulator